MLLLFNPITLRKAKTVYNFGLSECNMVKPTALKTAKTLLKVQ